MVFAISEICITSVVFGVEGDSGEFGVHGNVVVFLFSYEISDFREFLSQVELVDVDDGGLFGDWGRLFDVVVDGFG